MKTNFFHLIIFLSCLAQGVHAQGGFEQYCYFSKNGDVTIVPILHYQSFDNWYVEARYNYEELNSYSLYFGKTFASRERYRLPANTFLMARKKRRRKFSYSVTPMVGAVTGKFKGGSIGLNLTMDYGKIFFATQSQSTFSSANEDSSFSFIWSELAYQPSKWLFSGLAFQQTHFLLNNSDSFDPGIVVGFLAGLWTFPLYVFNPVSNNQYFVAGINLRLGSRIVEAQLK
jgi:hypothetical protein